MNIQLSPEAEKLIQQELERGKYDSASALVNEAIHQLVHLKRSDSESTSAILPESLIGVFDSSKESYSGKQSNPVTELVADKLQKQGITAAWRR